MSEDRCRSPDFGRRCIARSDRVRRGGKEYVAELWAVKEMALILGLDNVGLLGIELVG